jgi:hypothetical protein
MEGERGLLKEVDDFIFSLRLGEPDSFGNLTAFPLYSEYSRVDWYTLLDEAINTKKFIVTEINEAGRVPELKVLNGLDTDVLILDGEELVGAKQNRIVNTTIIIGRGKEVVVPVSCVEHGRWSYKSKDFKPSKSYLYAGLRSKKSKSVHENLMACRSYHSDQNEIWNDIREKSMRFSVSSETESMNDIYKSNDKKIEEYEKAFKLHPEQVGFIALIDQKVVGSDIFGMKSVLPKVYNKILRGYILDALDRDRKDEGSIPPDKYVLAGEVKRFLDQVRATKKNSFKSVGEGDDIRFEGNQVNGFALVNKDEIVHLAAFAQ